MFIKRNYYYFCMFKKVIIISTSNFNYQISTLFAVKELIESNIEVEYWNINNLTYKVNKTNTINKIDSNEIIINTFADFISKIKSAKKDCLFITYFNYCYYTAACYYILSKYKCVTLYCVNGIFPSVSVDRKKLNYWLGNSPFKRILAKILYKTSLIQPAKYELLTAGKANCEFKYNNKTVFYKFNSTDYQTYKNDNSSNYINSPYIVFVDQYYPYHTDVKIMGMKYIDDKLYFTQLNTFFNILENKYNKKVVIAAHPSALLYKKNNPFNNREIYYGKTSNLIKYSDGVLIHSSTAISFAVINNKPIIFLYNNDIKTKDVNSYNIMNLQSNLLDCPFISMDKNIPEIEFLNVNKEKYQKYMYDYLTCKELNGLDNYDILMKIIYNNNK